MAKIWGRMGGGRWLPALSVVLASCGPSAHGSADGDSADEQVGSSSQELVASRGLVPYPKKQLNGVPVLDANGKPIVLWNGSLPDLLAADAVANCFKADAYAYRPAPAFSTDTYFDYLTAKMKEVVGGNVAGIEQRWYTSRANRRLNVNSSTNADQALIFRPHDTTAYQIFPAGALPQFITATGATEAQRPLFWAEGNLCVAQSLRESLSAAQSLLMSAEDYREMLEIIRQRAQVAMLEYSHIAQLGSKANYTVIEPDYQPLGQLNQQLRTLTAARAAVMGSDFAASISLLANTAKELAEVLVRSGSARLPLGTSAATTAENDWRVGSWRHRVLSLLYGGDPFATQGSSGKLWQKFAGDPRTAAALDATRVPFVAEDMRAPEASTLLGLARRADALFLSAIRSTTTSPQGGFLTGIDLTAIDVATSAERLYRVVEASLRHPECIAQVAADRQTQACEKAIVNADVPTTANYTNSLLWLNYRITPEHARSLAASLGQAIPKVTATCTATSEYCTRAILDGPQQIRGTHWLSLGDDDFIPLRYVVSETPDAVVRTADNLPGATGTWYHLDPKFTAIPHSTPQRAKGFTDGFYEPSQVIGTATPATQKVVSGSEDRQMGAISALVAVRDQVLQATRDNGTGSFPNNTWSTEYLKRPNAAIEVITAAVGATSISIQPKLTFGYFAEAGCHPLVGSPSANAGKCYRSAVSSAAGNPVWRITYTTPKGTTPSLVRYGASAATPLSTSMDTPVTGCIAPSTGTALVTPGTTIQQTAYEISSKNGDASHFAGYDGDCKNAKLLATAVLKTGTFTDTSTGTSYPAPTNSYHLADGGTLGELAKRAWDTQEVNWSRPAFDGFGLPTDYVPIVDTTLLGANGNLYSADQYLTLAETAAAEANVRTKAAFEALLDEQIDDQAAENAQLEAATMSGQSNVSLCGSEQCSVATQKANLRTELSLPSRELADVTGFVKKVATRLALTADLLSPVATQLAASTLPNFQTNFGTSTLKSIADQQWDSVRKARNTLDEAESAAKMSAQQISEAQTVIDNAVIAYNSAVPIRDQRKTAAQAEAGAGMQASAAYDAAVAAAAARVEIATEKNKRECSDEAFEDAFLNGKSMSCDHDDMWWLTDDLQGKIVVTCTGTMQMSFSFAAINAQHKLCTETAEQLRIEQADEATIVANKPSTTGVTAANIAYREAAAAVGNAKGRVAEGYQKYTAALLGKADRLQQVMTKMDDANAQIVTSASAALKAVQDTKHNLAQIALRSQMTDSQLRTRLGTYQRFHSTDVLDARLAMEAARRYAVLARRALEARFVVDLSTMTSPEFTATAPATWADSVYEYDLDLKSSSGLSLVASPSGASDNNTTGPTNAAKIASYVSSLRNVRNNFFVSRPTQSAKNETEVFSVPGPGATLEMEVNGEFLTQLSPEALRWSFYCQNSNAWIPHPSLGTYDTTLLNTACPGVTADKPRTPPDKAKLAFSLDPWGRMESDISNPPLVFKYNGRWNKLAVNLVGSGVLNCGSDQACLASQSVRFNLAHLTPTIVSDRDQLWRSVAFPRATMEDGKAAAANLFLTAVTNSWNVPAVQNIARYEYLERPLGGSYELILMAGPKVRLQNIETVQVLTMVDFWVKSGG